MQGSTDLLQYAALLQTRLPVKPSTQDMLLPQQQFQIPRLEVLFLSPKEKRLLVLLSVLLCVLLGQDASVSFPLLCAGQQSGQELLSSLTAFVFRRFVAANSAIQTKIVETKAMILNFKTVVQFLHWEPHSSWGSHSRSTSLRPFLILQKYIFFPFRSFPVWGGRFPICYQPSCGSTSVGQSFPSLASFSGLLLFLPHPSGRRGTELCVFHL